MELYKEAIDQELFIHVIACMTLTLLITVYLGEEDQHELYFLRKILRGNGLDTKALQEEIFEYSGIANIFFNVNDKIVEKKYFEKY